MPTYRATDGAVLHYDDIGQVAGRPIIALAGGAALHPRYLGDLAGVGGRHHLVVPHLRGVGRSPAPSRAEAGSFWAQATDVESLRLHLGLEDVVLVGHSAGTRLAIAYAAQYPDRVRALVLITPPTGYLLDLPSDADALIDRRRGEPAFDAAIAVREAGPSLDEDAAPADNAAAFNAWQQACSPVGYAAWGPIEQAHARDGWWDLPAARAFFSVEPPTDLAARLAEVAAPVLVIAGADDCSTGLAPVLAVAELFPAGSTVVIDRCGHHPWVEQPAAFRAAIDTFLGSLA